MFNATYPVDVPAPPEPPLLPTYIFWLADNTNPVLSNTPFATIVVLYSNTSLAAGAVYVPEPIYNLIVCDVLAVLVNEIL
jgi:hypothetical protein